MKIISVVLIVKNEEKRIRQCIQSLLSQKSIEKTEIIVVDGASSDNTIYIVAKLATKYPFIRIIRCFSYGYSFQRNVGANAAEGKYILYISGDTVVAPNLIERYIRAIDEGYDIVQGTVINVPDKSKFSKSMASIYPVFYTPHIHTAYEQFSTINVLIKKEMIIENPFDEKLSSLEDKEWCYRNIQSAKFQRLKGAIIFHTVHETLIQYCKKIHKEAIAVGQISNKKSNSNYMDMNIFNWMNWGKLALLIVFLTVFTACGIAFSYNFRWLFIMLLILLPAYPVINTVYIAKRLPKKDRTLGGFIIYLFFWMVGFGVIRGNISARLKLVLKRPARL